MTRSITIALIIVVIMASLIYPEDKVEVKYLFIDIIHEASETHDVDPTIIQAMIMAESGYNHKAVSKKGAKGLMQLMPATAEALGVKNPFNPKQNIHAGTLYFSKLMERFEGDTKLALAAYHAGISNVLNYEGVPPFKSTRRYINKVYKYHKHYSVEGGESNGFGVD